MRLAATVAVGYGAFTIGRDLVRFVRYSDFFLIAEPRVEGASELVEGRIVALIDSIKQSDGDNLLLFDLGEAQRRIAALPRVRSAELRKDYPQQLIVTIVEREPMVAAQAGELYWMDADGVLLDTATPAEIVAAGVPILTGLRGSDLAPGVVLDQPHLNETLDTIDFLRREDPQLAKRIVEWHLNPLDEIVGILRAGVEVRFGNAHPLSKIPELKVALSRERDLARRTYYDLRFEGRIFIL